jgi:hypothetical protein|tara:strand:+ start:57727 stop:58104 length:378 start_codon:yes stop_codon:yes gene_type:complete
MFWQISFWILVALIVLPLPFKIYEYATGKDKSSIGVKIEEMSNALFMAVGLIAFYGYLNDQVYLFPSFWITWLVISVIWSVSAMFWSPKLTYATEVMGKTKMRIFAGIGLVLYSPLFLAVYFYAI